jgi:hypothetical protein
MQIASARMTISQASATTSTKWARKSGAGLGAQCRMQAATQRGTVEMMSRVHNLFPSSAIAQAKSAR